MRRDAMRYYSNAEKQEIERSCYFQGHHWSPYDIIYSQVDNGCWDIWVRLDAEPLD